MEHTKNNTSLETIATSTEDIVLETEEMSEQDTSILSDVATLSVHKPSLVYTSTTPGHDHSVSGVKEAPASDDTFSSDTKLEVTKLEATAKSSATVLEATTSSQRSYQQEASSIKYDSSKVALKKCTVVVYRLRNKDLWRYVPGGREKHRGGNRHPSKKLKKISSETTHNCINNDDMDTNNNFSSGIHEQTKSSESKEVHAGIKRPREKEIDFFKNAKIEQSKKEKLKKLKLESLNNKTIFKLIIFKPKMLDTDTIKIKKLQKDESSSNIKRPNADLKKKRPSFQIEPDIKKRKKDSALDTIPPKHIKEMSVKKLSKTTKIQKIPSIKTSSIKTASTSKPSKEKPPLILPAEKSGQWRVEPCVFIDKSINLLSIPKFYVI